MTNEEKTLAEIYKLLDDIENDDEDLPVLEKAMNYYCGTYDICEGYKEAIRFTLHDQYNNHRGENDPEDLLKLKDLLNHVTTKTK